MLNYIKAELWRIFHQRGIYLLAAALSGGTLLFCAAFHNGSFQGLASAVCVTMIVGVLAAPALAQMVDSCAMGTAKNELSFGLTRERIYLGRLYTSLLVGAGLSLLLVGLSLGGGWLLLPHSAREEDWVALLVAGSCIAAAFPVWCGMLSACHMLSLFFRGNAGWVAAYYLMLLIGAPVVMLAAVSLLNQLPEQGSVVLQAVIAPVVLMLPGVICGQLNWEYQVLCWGVGLFWLAGTTVLGLTIFQKIEL